MPKNYPDYSLNFLIQHRPIPEPNLNIGFFIDFRKFPIPSIPCFGGITCNYSNYSDYTITRRSGFYQLNSIQLNWILSGTFSFWLDKQRALKQNYFMPNSNFLQLTCKYDLCSWHWCTLKQKLNNLPWLQKSAMFLPILIKKVKIIPIIICLYSWSSCKCLKQMLLCNSKTNRFPILFFKFSNRNCKSL